MQSIFLQNNAFSQFIYFFKHILFHYSERAFACNSSRVRSRFIQSNEISSYNILISSFFNALLFGSILCYFTVLSGCSLVIPHEWGQGSFRAITFLWSKFLHFLMHCFFRWYYAYNFSVMTSDLIYFSTILTRSYLYIFQ